MHTAFAYNIFRGASFALFHKVPCPMAIITQSNNKLNIITMKQNLLKLWTLIVCLVVGAGSAWADSYTITFGNSVKSPTAIAATTKATTVIASGTEYVTASPFKIDGSAYYGDNQNSIRLGKKSEAGTLTIALSEQGKVNATSIVVNAALYNASKAATLTVNGGAGQALASTDAADYTYTLDGSKLESIVLSTNVYAFVYSITVNYNGGGTVTPPVDTDMFAYTLDIVGNGTATFKTEGGKVVAPSEKVAKSTKVFPTFTPAEGWSLDKWEYFSSTSEWRTLTSDSFTITKDVKFRVTFVEGTPVDPVDPEYTVTIVAPENGTLDVVFGDTPVKSGDKFHKGDKLVITATPSTGYKFRNLQVIDASTHTFTASNVKEWGMGEHDITIKANFDADVFYTINWSVDGKIVKTESLAEGAAVTAPNVESVNGLEFLGWTTTASVDPANAPEYASPATATADATYYAVFASKSGEGYWRKVTDISALTNGDMVTFVSSTEVKYNVPSSKEAANGYVAISSQNTNNWKGVGVTLDGDILAISDDVQAFTLTATDNDDYPWAFFYDDKYIYAASSSSNYLKSKAKLEDNAQFSISITDGAATITANSTGRNTIQVNGSYNSGSDTANPIFSCYAPTASNTKPSIFKNTPATYSGLTTTPSNTATAIEAATAVPASAGVYNLHGQRVSKVQRGINIEGGRRVIR